MPLRESKACGALPPAFDASQHERACSCTDEQSLAWTVEQELTGCDDCGRFRGHSY